MKKLAHLPFSIERLRAILHQPPQAHQIGNLLTICNFTLSAHISIGTSKRLTMTLPRSYPRSPRQEPI